MINVVAIYPSPAPVFIGLVLLCLSVSSHAQVAYYNFAQSLHNADVTFSAGSTSNGSFSGSTFTPDASASSANVNTTDLLNFLNSGTSVTITTANKSGNGTGDINLSTLTWTGTFPSSLNLYASNTVNIIGAVTATNGSLVSQAYNNVNIGSAMTITNGNMTFLARNNVNLSAATTVTTGDFTATAGGVVNVAAANTVTGGRTTISSGVLFDAPQAGGAPEIDGSLAPKVGFLLGCLFLMFGRKKQAAEPILTV